MSFARSLNSWKCGAIESVQLPVTAMKGSSKVLVVLFFIGNISIGLSQHRRCCGNAARYLVTDQNLRRLLQQSITVTPFTNKGFYLSRGLANTGNTVRNLQIAYGESEFSYNRNKESVLEYRQQHTERLNNPQNINENSPDVDISSLEASPFNHIQISLPEPDEGDIPLLGARQLDGTNTSKFMIKAPFNILPSRFPPPIEKLIENIQNYFSTYNHQHVNKKPTTEQSSNILTMKITTSIPATYSTTEDLPADTTIKETTNEPPELEQENPSKDNMD